MFWTWTNYGLRCAKFGQPPVKRFYNGHPGSLKHRFASCCVQGLVRRVGGYAKPEHVGINESWKVGEYLAGLIRQGSNPCILTSPSEAVRLSIAIQQYSGIRYLYTRRKHRHRYLGHLLLLREGWGTWNLI